MGTHSHLLELLKICSQRGNFVCIFSFHYCKRRTQSFCLADRFERIGFTGCELGKCRIQFDLRFNFTSFCLPPSAASRVLSGIHLCVTIILYFFNRCIVRSKTKKDCLLFLFYFLALNGEF